MTQDARLTRVRSGAAPSPVFLAIVAVALLAGILLWIRVGPPGIVTFVFVTALWVVSLCLHEFAHALVAYRNGDSSVIYRGYLTLNPLKYTHAVLSIVLPLLFLIAGGIGLPGGAVFINRAALRTRFANSATSAAGPLTNLAFAIVIALALVFRGNDHKDFWGAIAFLLFLQVTATVLNLLPIPGLDGYGIIEPYLPNSWRAQAAAVAPFAVIGVFALLWIPALNTAFFSLIYAIVNLFGAPPILVDFGHRLYMFWLGLA